MLGVAVAVHEGDGDGAKGRRDGALSSARRADSRSSGTTTSATGVYALRDLLHAGVQHIGQHDGAREDVGAVLVADA